MERIKLTEDVRSLSDFRADTASCIKQINDTKRPMLITQRGRGVAVLMGLNEYESLLERLEVLQNNSEK